MAAANSGIERELRADAAKRLGITPALVEELHSLSESQQQEILERIRESKAAAASQSQFPSDDSRTSDTRLMRAKDRADQAPKISREARERTLRISSDKSEVRTYLAEKYSTDGKLYCQMSHEPMPFRLPSGQPFFEAVELLSLGNECTANYLCLSPVCAAEFKYALQTTNASLRARLEALDPNRPEPELTIQVEVPLRQHRTVRFRRAHLMDLQAAIRISAHPTGVREPSSAEGPRLIHVQEPVTVAEAAILLGEKTHRVIGELIGSGIFKEPHDELTRKQIEKLALKWGFTVIFVRTADAG
jgi:hypothetical protein